MTTPPKTLRRNQPGQVKSGADVLADMDFAPLAGKRVGLITNQTGLVYGEHLADALHRAPGVTLAAILGPEHGFRGNVEAGDKVTDGVDPATGVRVLSLYGKTRKPTPEMLKGIDILVFDIQDIGARFYTYISTMGLAMEAAAAAGIPFVVLDRPNPLGGDYVAGFTLEPRFTSFVGQFPIPIVHGLTVCELAIMIQGQKWMSGLEKLDLRIMKMEGWRRSMRWTDTKRQWVATSPNIPTFRSALVYPGIGMVGETQLVNEGRGMPEPFTLFGAPWLDAKRIADRLNAQKLGGIQFVAMTYTPRSIPKVAANPLYAARSINGVRLVIRDVGKVRSLDIGMHALAELIAEARRRKRPRLFAKPGWFHFIAGTKRLHNMLIKGVSGQTIVRSWRADVDAFKRLRAPYLLYE